MQLINHREYPVKLQTIPDRLSQGAEDFTPKSFDCLRRVPAYSNFVRERFERCLDLYLCPRVRRMRHFVNPEVTRHSIPFSK